MANFLGKQDDELVRKIDSGIKNKWKWSWLEKTPYMLPLSVLIKKSSKPGEAYCVLCNATIKYGGKGASSLKQPKQDSQIFQETGCLEEQNPNMLLQ